MWHIDRCFQEIYSMNVKLKMQFNIKEHILCPNAGSASWSNLTFVIG